MTTGAVSIYHDLFLMSLAISVSLYARLQVLAEQRACSDKGVCEAGISLLSGKYQTETSPMRHPPGAGLFFQLELYFA